MLRVKNDDIDDDLQPLDDSFAQRKGCSSLNQISNNNDNNNNNNNYYYYPDVKENKKEIMAQEEYAYTAVCRGKKLLNTGSQLTITTKQQKKMTDDLIQYMMKTYDMSRKMGGYLADNLAYVEKHQKSIDAYWQSQNIRDRNEMQQDIENMQNLAFDIQRQLYSCIASEFQTMENKTLELDMSPDDMQIRAYEIINDMLHKFQNDPELMQRILYRSVSTGCGNLEIIIEQAEAQFYPAMALIQKKMVKAKELGGGGIIGNLNRNVFSTSRSFLAGLKRISDWINSFSRVTISIVIQHLGILTPIVITAIQSMSITSLMQIPIGLVCGASVGFLQYYMLQYTFAFLDKIMYQKQRNDPTIDPKASKLLDLLMEKCKNNPKKCEEIIKMSKANTFVSSKKGKNTINTNTVDSKLTKEQKKEIKTQFAQLTGTNLIPEYVWSGLWSILRWFTRAIISMVVMGFGSAATIACQSMLGDGFANFGIYLFGRGESIEAKTNATETQETISFMTKEYNTIKDQYDIELDKYLTSNKGDNKMFVDSLEIQLDFLGQAVNKDSISDKLQTVESIFHKIKRHNVAVEPIRLKLNKLVDEHKELLNIYNQQSIFDNVWHNTRSKLDSKYQEWKIVREEWDKNPFIQYTNVVAYLNKYKQALKDYPNKTKVKQEFSELIKQAFNYSSFTDNAITRIGKGIVMAAAYYIKVIMGLNFDSIPVISQIMNAFTKAANATASMTINQATPLIELLNMLKYPTLSDIGASAWLSTFLALSYVLSEFLFWILSSKDKVPTELESLKPHPGAPPNTIIPSVKGIDNTTKQFEHDIKDPFIIENEARNPSMSIQTEEGPSLSSSARVSYDTQISQSPNRVVRNMDINLEIEKEKAQIIELQKKLDMIKKTE